MSFRLRSHANPHTRDNGLRTENQRQKMCPNLISCTMHRLDNMTSQTISFWSISKTTSFLRVYLHSVRDEPAQRTRRGTGSGCRCTGWQWRCARRRTSCRAAGRRRGSPAPPPGSGPAGEHRGGTGHLSLAANHHVMSHTEVSLLLFLSESDSRLGLIKLTMNLERVASTGI